MRTFQTFAGATTGRPSLGLRVLLMLVAALLSGCGTFDSLTKANNSPGFPALDAHATLVTSNPSATALQQHAAADQDFNSAIVFCRAVLNFYERGAKRVTASRLLLGGTGAIAGAVIAPSLAAGGAAKSTIAAWAGLSGATNLFLTDMGSSAVNEGFYLSERRNVAEALHTLTREVAETQDPLERVRRSRILAAACVTSEFDKKVAQTGEKDKADKSALASTSVAVRSNGPAAEGTAATPSDYAAWAGKNTDRSWTTLTEKAVAGSSLAASVPLDVEKFCPAYASRNIKDRQTFWVGLLSSIARPESNFKPETLFVEPDTFDAQGKNVVSRGLLQLSIESANQKAYACDIKKAEDLHQPAVNLPCGVKILEHGVQRDNVIASYGAQAPTGGARYWSTLRERQKHLPELISFTRSLKICAAG